MIRCCLAAFVTAVCLTAAVPAAGQSREGTGRLLLTVADPSGAVIPNARVTVTRQGGAGSAPVLEPVLTSAEGVAVIPDLAPGAYSVTAEFPGFEKVMVVDYPVRPGDNRKTVTLPIRMVLEDVTVDRDGQSASLDPRGDAFSTVLTREMIDALPDDPDDMEAALRAMSPPGATLRIDGFTGGKLPPKQQIRSIRLPRMDAMAAQNHGGMTGMMHIDILTMPGGGPIGGSIDFTLRDDALNARNPFTPAKGDEGLRQGGLTLSGGIVPNRSSFSVTIQRASVFDSGSLLAATPGGTVAESIRRPGDRFNVHARFDQALTNDRVLRVIYGQSETDSRNLGVGGFDLAERAYATDSSSRGVRISENGPVGRRSFAESRLELRWTESRASSAIEAPTRRVLDAFTAGGAQRRGGTRAVTFEAATDWDYVRGPHSFRTGVLLEGGRYRSDDFSNYLGTYTFASLADYEAGRAANFTQRIGDPEVEFTNLQLGVYAQDDYRVAKSLLLSYGLRYETQNLLPDRRNFSPRVSVSWSPWENGGTTFRGGWGLFTDWLDTGVWEQSLRLDGVRQREINVTDPLFDQPDQSTTALPSNRYVLDDALVLPESMMANAGVDQQLPGGFRVTGTYTYRRGAKLFRGRNLNAPVDGVRPDPSFANVVESVGDGEATYHALGVSASLMKLEWRQTFFMASYTLTSSRTNAPGAFWLPSNADDLAAEWGPSLPRHRLGGAFNMKPIPALGLAVNFRAQSGTPYDITTGSDDNGDGIFNDRPAGVSRNAALTDMQWDVGLRVSYAMGFGRRGEPGGGRTVVLVAGSGGGMPGGFTGGSSESRYQMEFYLAAQNVTNRQNYVGYSGVLTSPFFGQATNVMNPRKVEIGVRFGF